MFLFGGTHNYLHEKDFGKLRKVFFSDLCRDLSLFDHAKGKENEYYNLLASFIKSKFVGLTPAWVAYLILFRFVYLCL